MVGSFKLQVSFAEYRLFYRVCMSCVVGTVPLYRVRSTDLR